MAEHNDDMTYKSRFHFMCSCYRLPEDLMGSYGLFYDHSDSLDDDHAYPNGPNDRSWSIVCVPVGAILRWPVY